MSTPIYANNQPSGCSSQGVVSYSTSVGNTSMLPPSYAGDRWDAFTPWDTSREKKAKQEAQEAADIAYQEQLANIANNQGEVRSISPVVYGLMALVTLGAGYALIKS